MTANDREIMSEQLEELIEAQKMILTKDELFIAGAMICKKSYDALRGVGFEIDEAIRIVASGGMKAGK